MSANIFGFSVSAKTLVLARGNLRKQVKSQRDGRSQNAYSRARNAVMSKTILIMAGGTGGHIFGYGRATRLTFAALILACTEKVSSMEVSYG